VSGEKAIREKTAVNEKTIFREKVVVSSKSATAESISLPKSEPTRRPKFMPKTGAEPHAYLTASPAPPQGYRQSPEGCGNQKDTKLFHRCEWLTEKSRRPSSYSFFEAKSPLPSRNSAPQTHSVRLSIKYRPLAVNFYSPSHEFWKRKFPTRLLG
jgi:hypothetical protein